MARLAMRKLENRRSLQVTFTKRRKGLVKKAYELAILCDVDIALITFSPAGRPFLFSGKKRIEDVIERYIDQLPDSESKERLNRIMGSLERENMSNVRASSSTYNLPTNDSSYAKLSELKQEIGRLQSALEEAEERLRIFRGGPVEKASTVDMDSCERDLLDILTRVRQRKEYLLNNFVSSYYISPINIPSSSGNELVQQLPDYANVVDASETSNPFLDMLQTEFDPSKMYYAPTDMPQESIPFTFQVRLWRAKTSSFSD